MKEAQTISEVLKKLNAQGYIHSFRAEKSGLMACGVGTIFPPEDLVVDGIHRFEGETDLDEEAMIFALSGPKHKIKGTYLVAFGRQMDPLDEEMVQRLERKK